MSSNAPPPSQRLVDLLEGLNNLQEILLDSVDLMMDQWALLRQEFDVSSAVPNASQELRLFLFSTWAVSNVAPQILRLICAKQQTASIDALDPGNRSRLASIANNLSDENEIVYFVLEKQSSNHRVQQAFAVLKNRVPDITLQQFYQNAETKCYEMAQSRDVKRATLVRETLKALGADVWAPQSVVESPSRAPSTASSFQGFSPVQAATSFPSSQAPLSVAPSSVSGSEIGSVEPRRPPISRTRTRIPSRVHRSPSGFRPPRGDDGDMSFPPSSSVVAETPEVARPGTPVPFSGQRSSSVVPFSGQSSFFREESHLSLPPLHLEQELSTPIHFSSSPKRPSDAEDTETREKRHATVVDTTLSVEALPLPHVWKATVAPLSDTFESAKARLVPGEYLNDTLVNVALVRCRSDNVGVVTTYELIQRQLSAEKVARLNSLFSEKSLVLLPANDAEAQHWRLYVWRSPSTLEVLDPMVGLADHTTEHVVKFVRHVTGNQSLEAFSVACPQQPNAFDCGMFVIRFAELISAGADPSSLIANTNSVIWRKRTMNKLLTSEDRCLPLWEFTPLVTTLRALYKRHATYLRLAEDPLPFAPTLDLDANRLTWLRAGMEGDQYVMASLHRRHQSFLAKGLEPAPGPVAESAPYVGISQLIAARDFRQALDIQPGHRQSAEMNALDAAIAAGLPKVEREIAAKRAEIRAQWRGYFTECKVAIIIMAYVKQKYEGRKQEYNELVGAMVV
ncbi:hypothetical protein ACHAQK_012225 [Fusarium lateritium]